MPGIGGKPEPHSVEPPRIRAERPGLSAIIVPHADYVYSGSVAAQAFARVPNARNRFHRCVIIGPSHLVAFNGIAAPSHMAFATPLGELPIDVDAVQALVSGARIVIDDVAHEHDHAVVGYGAWDFACTILAKSTTC